MTQIQISPNCDPEQVFGGLNYVDAKAIKKALVHHMHEVAEFLLPNGQLENQKWTCGSLAGEPGQSLKVELYGDKAGLWFDFATEEGGDIFDLWQQVQQVDFTRMLGEIDQFLQDPPRLETPVSTNNLRTKMSKQNRNGKPKALMNPVPTHTWYYQDDERETIGKVVRRDSIDGEGKEVNPYFKPDGYGGFLPGIPTELKDKRPLYGDRPDERGNIVITEGEKAADAVRQLGLPACTSLGGCNSAGKADWLRLRDARQVLIWADNDKPGQKYAEMVASLVFALAPDADIRILNYGKEGQDAADFVYDELERMGQIWDGYEESPEIRKLASQFKTLANTAVKWKPPTLPKKSPQKHRARQGSLILESFDKLDAEKVAWIWDGKIAEGKLNLLTGEPDTGKTNVGCFIVSTITTGNCWPFSHESPDPSHVLVLSSEDGSADTLVPRLMAYGADLSRVHRIKALTKGIGTDEKESAEVGKLTTTNLIKSLRESIPQHGNVRLIFIDPLSAYLDVRNAHSEADIRSALEPLADFAEEYGIAILAVAHVNKSGTDNAMDKISGSKGVVAQARTCYMAIKANSELGETDNYLAKVKCNIASPETSLGLKYRIEGTIVRNKSGEEIETSRVVWTGTCTDDASQILKKRNKDIGQKQLIGAERWLVQFLEDSPRLKADVVEAGKAEGHSERTLDRARTALDFAFHRIGFGGNSFWFNKQQYERFQALLDQDIPSDEALAQLDSESSPELLESVASWPCKESIPAIPAIP